ncbi:hypothetical protein GC176_24625 [bacterium]|nr:hypothetical protein [bacterium]
MKTLRLKGENFAWRVSEELLRREIPESEAKTTTDNKPRSQGGGEASDAIVEILRKQLDIKDQQIAAQNELIKSMSERLREGNILMGSLQQQLAPPKSATQTPKDSVVDDHPKTPSEQGTAEYGLLRRILYRKIF